MGGRRLQRWVLGFCAGAVGGAALAVGPMAGFSGTAGAAEACTTQVGISDPAVCVGVDSDFGGLLIVLVGSSSTDTLLLGGFACFTDEPRTYNAHLGGKLLGQVLTPVAVDTNVPCTD